MPHIRMRAITPEQAATLSSNLPSDLSQIIQTPIDNFTFELIETRFFEKVRFQKRIHLLKFYGLLAHRKCKTLVRD